MASALSAEQRSDEHRPADSAPPAKRTQRPPRKDIQALRAIAVALVVLYHFWPKRLTGGYIGVDVFFVISGFLITTHLAGMTRMTVRGLFDFWARRVRRLLPAAFLVLAVTLLGVWLWAPITTWATNAGQVIASALYVENWALAAASVDYLAADNAASAVQHFWSLSVEEQFYLVWPVLFLLAGFVALRWKRLRYRGLLVGFLGAVTVVSIVLSVVLSPIDTGAYFSTFTRAWQFGAGGLLALLMLRVGPAVERIPSGVRAAMSWLGLAVIFAGALLFDSHTVFPGTAALVPVIGTLLVIGASSPTGRLSPAWLMARRPVQFLGDVSYSTYLWHWPVVIIAPYALGHTLGTWQKCVALVAVVLVAWATKVFVEDRLRSARRLSFPVRRSFVFAAAGMAVVTALSAVVLLDFNRISTAPIDASSRCFASSAVADHSCDPHGVRLLTNPAFAKKDLPDPYKDQCWAPNDFSSTTICHYGSKNPTKRIALVGNSHAGMWLPALQELAKKNNWQITTYLIFECYPADRVIAFPQPVRTTNCKAWNDRVIPEVARGGYDAIVTGNRTFREIQGYTGAASLQQAQASYARVLTKWADSGTPVLVIHEPPELPNGNTPDCVAKHMSAPTKCDGPRSKSMPPDPMSDAAVSLKRSDVRVSDQTNRFCRAVTCYAVAGGVIPYYDKSHVTATFARSLAKPIGADLEALLGHRPAPATPAP